MESNGVVSALRAALAAIEKSPPDAAAASTVSALLIQISQRLAASQSGLRSSKLSQLPDVMLVVNIISEDDALAVALTCRDLRDAVLGRFADTKEREVLREYGSRFEYVQTRLRSGIAANIMTVSRLSWAVSCGMSLWDMGRELCHEAARSGRLETLQWLCENGTEARMALLGSRAAPIYDGSTCAGAAAGGQLHVLQWLHGIGCRMDAGTMHSAAAMGHVHILEWAHSNGAEWCRSACEAAAACGQFDVLKWLHDHGCEWGTRTCSIAAEFGRLAELRYAHEHGCPWDGMTLHYACSEGHSDVLAYALANECPKTLEDRSWLSSPSRPCNEEERANYEERCRATREEKDSYQAELEKSGELESTLVCEPWSRCISVHGAFRFLVYLDESRVI